MPTYPHYFLDDHIQEVAKKFGEWIDLQMTKWAKNICMHIKTIVEKHYVVSNTLSRKGFGCYQPFKCNKYEYSCHSAMELRINTKFCYKLGKSLTYINAMLEKTYGAKKPKTPAHTLQSCMQLLG